MQRVEVQKKCGRNFSSLLVPRYLWDWLIRWRLAVAAIPIEQVLEVLRIPNVSSKRSALSPLRDDYVVRAVFSGCMARGSRLIHAWVSRDGMELKVFARRLGVCTSALRYLHGYHDIPSFQSIVMVIKERFLYAYWHWPISRTAEGFWHVAMATLYIPSKQL